MFEHASYDTFVLNSSVFYKLSDVYYAPDASKEGACFVFSGQLVEDAFGAASLRIRPQLSFTPR